MRRVLEEVEIKCALLALCWMFAICDIAYQLMSLFYTLSNIAIEIQMLYPT